MKTRRNTLNRLWCAAIGILFIGNLALADDLSSAPTLDAAFNYKKTGLRCFYREDPSNLTPQTAYKWGMDPRRIDDKQYVIKGYWSVDFAFSKKMFYTETTQKELRSVCQYTLNRMGIDAPVAMFAAADSELDVNFTIWSLDPVRQSGNINKIVAFGDSLSDTQNVFNASEWTMPTTKNYFAGRFSNGWVWLDYLSETLDLPLYNWAVGGAGAGDEMQGLIKGVKSQVKSWVKYMDKDLATHYRPEFTLFTMLIGGNDLISYNRSPERIIEKERQALENLIAHGGKNILLLNLPDLSSVPVVKLRVKSKQELIAAQVITYNAALATLVDELRVKHRDVNIHLFNTHKLINHLLEYKERYHLAHIDQPCLDLDKDTVKNYTKRRYPTAECVNAKDQADSFAFWDLIHPTTYTHKLLADNVTCFVRRKFNPMLGAVNWLANAAPACDFVG